MSGERKLLVVGCGSIGRRHAGNAVNTAGIGSIAVCDQNAELADEAAKLCDGTAFSDLDAALDWGPDAVIVAVPHRAHVPVAKAALSCGAAVLVEKPISDDPIAAADLVAHADALGLPLYTVCNMRFHAAVATLKQHLASVGKIHFARAHVGNYLPEMRPNADYRELYCANRDQGGGVVLDAIHEIDYLSWLLGPVNAVTADAGNIGGLDIDVEDYAAMLMRHQSGARSEVHMDYLQRFKRRGCEIVGSDGTMIWESLGKRPEHCTVRLFRFDSGAWETLHEDPDIDPNAAYIRLMNNFMAALNGDDNDLHTGVEAVHALKVACAVRTLSEQGSGRTPIGIEKIS